MRSDTHTFIQTHRLTDMYIHTDTQPVSEITEQERESPPDWALYLGMPDLFTLMSVGEKVKKNKLTRQHLHVFSKQNSILISHMDYLAPNFCKYTAALEIGGLSFPSLTWLWKRRRNVSAACMHTCPLSHICSMHTYKPSSLNVVLITEGTLQHCI